MRNSFIDILRHAGDLAKDRRLSNQVHTKAVNDFVTDADMAVHAYLEKELLRMIPSGHFFSEEGTNEASLAGKVFIADPIDGTTNLTYGLNLSAVSVALLEDGIPLIGGVYNPFTQEMFIAEAGKGATLNDCPIYVNEDATLQDALIGVEAGPITVTEQRKLFASIYGLHAQSKGIRLTGSAALDLAYVACGRFTAAACHYLFPWDWAAGWLLITEAGGTVSDSDGNIPPLDRRVGPFYASNGLCHEALLREMR